MIRIARRQNTEGFAKGGNLPPLLQRIFSARGVQAETNLQYTLDKLIPFTQLFGIENAAQVLGQAIVQQKRLLIVGDFDADGATSTALAVSALRAFGAQHIDYLVPNRFEFGYGLTPEIVAVAKAKNPELIITVDNGIASFDGVAAANALGIDVLITDHHLPAGDKLPDAAAVVNPNQPGCEFPSKNLAGVGVIFYLLLATRRWLEQHHDLKPPNMGQFLDLVALGTVADVVPLDYNNRILVQQGLLRIRAGKARPGITSLLQLGKRTPRDAVASDLGFAVGPRLNAAGRLDDMTLGIECLLATDPNQAHQLAQRLDTLNAERRAIEFEMREQALKIVDNFQFEQSQLPRGLCLYQPDWHQGVVGIVASRIKEKTHRPVIAFAKVSDKELKGSARSIKGLHIRDVLDQVASQNPGLVTKFGGHAMAAGLSIPAESYSAFSQAFDQVVAALVTDHQLQGEVETDGDLAASEYTLPMAEALRQAGPWGQGFPEPLFDGQFEILEQRLLQDKHLRLTLGFKGTDTIAEAIAFNVDRKLWPNPECRQAEIVYKMDINVYNNARRVQMVVEHLNPLT